MANEPSEWAMKCAQEIISNPNPLSMLTRDIALALDAAQQRAASVRVVLTVIEADVTTPQYPFVESDRVELKPGQSLAVIERRDEAARRAAGLVVPARRGPQRLL